MAVEYELCVKSSTQNLAAIAEFVAERAREAGLDDDSIFDIQIAVDEACTNTIEHAYATRSDQTLRVCCSVQDQEFVIRITDYGTPFDPDSIPEPDLEAPMEERSIGGLGVFFMRRLMDSVEFSTHAYRGNQVVMRKRFVPNDVDSTQ